MKNSIFIRILFATLLAFTVNSFVYFGFANIYSSKILNYAAFQEQFNSGIYQYRVLSGQFLIWIYEFLGNFNIDYQLFKLKFLNPDSEPRMYISFFILNTFFLVLSAIMMVLITETKNFAATDAEKILMTAVAVFTIALSQFVIVPYDVSSYFFLLLFFWFLIRYLNENSTVSLIILTLILMVSTLNRESSALSISLAATLLYSKFGLRKETLVPVGVLALGFIAVYLGMRWLNQSFTTNDGNLLAENLTQPKNYLGMLFWLVFFIFTLMLAKDKTAIRNILIFHLLAVPYLAMCWYTGILYEVRLYVPVFLTSLFLTKISLDEKGT